MGYASPSMRIGKHEWRMIVVPAGRYPGTASGYQFRPIGETAWRSEAEWPGYDRDDGAHGGMPKRLATLYRRHRANVMAALRGEQAVGMLPLS